MEQTEIETVAVTLEIPKGIIELLKAWGRDAEQYLGWGYTRRV